MNTEIKILFICHGNVDGSQIAEGYYNSFTHSSNASSAGIDPSTPEKYKTLDPDVIKVMREENIDLSSKQVKIVTEEMVNSADKIIILCKKEDCPDFLLNHPSFSFWETEDPDRNSIDALRFVRDKIKQKTFGLMRIY